MPILIGRQGHYKGMYVGRPTALGNPFPITDTCSREQVCDQYKAWFNNQLTQSNPAFHKHLRGLAAQYKKTGNLTLLCYCYPLPCHAETIRDWIYETVGDNHA